MITGGARGIGRAIALYLAREGCDLVLGDVLEDMPDGTPYEKATRQRILPVVDKSRTVTLEQVRAAIRVMAEKARIVAEGAAALPLAAVLAGHLHDGPTVCVVSGDIDMDTFCACVGDAAERGTD